MLEGILEEASIHELTDLLEKTDPRIVRRGILEANDADLAIFLLTLEKTNAKLAKHAAQILAQFPLDKQIVIAEQIATTEEIIDAEQIKEIYTRLANQITAAAKGTVVFGDGTSNLAKLLSRMKIDNQNRLLESLAERQPNLVNKINEEIFTFDDIANLTNESIQTILQMLDPSTIAIALHKAPTTIVEKFLHNMPAESVASLEQDMNNLTFEQTQIADTARQSIVNMIRRFVAKGMITLDNEV